jgi:hypothetical protein
MEKRRRKKHNSHKRGLVIANEHRPFLASAQGGTATVDTLEHAVADEAAALTDQEHSRFEYDSASDRVEKLRDWLFHAVKLFAAVSGVVTPAGTSMPFDGSRPPNDDQLIARVEVIHAAASTDPDAFVKAGMTPRGLETLDAQLAAFKQAKDTMTLAGKQHNEARGRFDRAAEQARGAILILEGILATEPDAPAGALNALRQARRIGPRVAGDEQPASGQPDNPAGTPAEIKAATAETPAETAAETPAETMTPAATPVPDKAA